MDLDRLKLALLLFWSAWFAIVFATNAFSALKAAGRLPQGWRFASRNYEAVAKAVSVHRAPGWVPAALFAGVLAWQLAACVLFCDAFFVSLAAAVVQAGAADRAFAAGIGLFAAFMVADELTIKYAYEQAHELLLVAQLACLVVMHLA